MCLFQYVIVRVFSCALRESSTPDVWGSDGGFGFSVFFFFSSRRRHTRCLSDWSSDVCSSDLRRKGVRRASGLEDSTRPTRPTPRPAYCSRRAPILPHLRVPREQRREVAAVRPDQEEAQRRQIGRASCRERV